MEGALRADKRCAGTKGSQGRECGTTSGADTGPNRWISLLIHSSPISIAECLGLGIKFYSVFTDGTLLTSSSYRSALAADPNSQIIQNPHCQSPEEAWLAHKQKSAELELRGSRVQNLSSFAD
jgi:hypothetical protein